MCNQFGLSRRGGVLALEVEKSLAVEAKERQALAAVQGNKNRVKDFPVSQIVEQPGDENKSKSSQKAAELVGTNRQYVSDAKKIAVRCQFGLVPTLTGGPRISSQNGAFFTRELNRRPPLPSFAKPSCTSALHLAAIKWSCPKKSPAPRSLSFTQAHRTAQ